MKSFMSRGPRWLELGMYLIIFVVVVQQIAASESDLAPSQDCYYNYNHYSEGDRILTNEPCLNCTCHNRMLMCYLKVCPFTKPIGQDCTVEKREDQCCPIITCPEVPVELDSSAAQSSSALASHQPYGCSFDDKFYAEGAQLPGNPKKPCELCYCIRNMTSCVMQECTLHVDGCRPIYNKGVCCPVRYDCTHEYDDSLLLEDQTTTEAPSEGFVLQTTPQPSTQCHHNDTQYYDGELILTDEPCEHCYCMRGDIVCAVQECVRPDALNGKNCTARTPAAGECCAKDYDCISDEQPTTILPIESLNTVTTQRAEQVDSSPTTVRAVTEAEATERIVESDVAEVPTTERVDDAENEIHDKDYDHITSKPSKIDTHLEPDVTTLTSVDEQPIVTAQPSLQQNEENDGILSNLYTTIKSIVELTTTFASTPESEIPSKHSSEEEHSMLANVIPGEGDCLEHGVSYSNSSTVPGRSKCEISCLCLNSIVYCEKIQCSPIPPNAHNCRRLEDPSLCCPRYECDRLDAPITAVPLAMVDTTEQEKSEATTLGASVAVVEDKQPESIPTTERSESTTLLLETPTAPSKVHLSISSKLEDSLEQETESVPVTGVERETVAQELEPVTQSGAAVTEAVATEAVESLTLGNRLDAGDKQTEREQIATEKPVAIEATTLLAVEPVQQEQATTQSAVEPVQQEQATTQLAVEPVQDEQGTTSQPNVAKEEESHVTTEKLVEVAVTEQEHLADATTARHEEEKQPEPTQSEGESPVDVTKNADDEKVLSETEVTTQTKDEPLESDSVTTQKQPEESIVTEQATPSNAANEEPIVSTESERKPEIVTETPQLDEQEGDRVTTQQPSIVVQDKVPATEQQPEQGLSAPTTQRLEEEQELTTSRAELPPSNERKKQPTVELLPPLEESSTVLATESPQSYDAITEDKQSESESSSTESPALPPLSSESATETQKQAEITTQRQSEVTDQSISSTEAVISGELPATEQSTTQRQSEFENEIPTLKPAELENVGIVTEKETESPQQEQEAVTTTSTPAQASDEKLAPEIPAAQEPSTTDAPSAEIVTPSEEGTTVKPAVSHDEAPQAPGAPEVPEWTTETREQPSVTEKQPEIEPQSTEGQSSTSRVEPEIDVTTQSRGVEPEIAVTTEKHVAEEESIATTEGRPLIAVEPSVTEQQLPAIQESVASTESQPSDVHTENRIEDKEPADVTTERIAAPAEEVTTEVQKPIHLQTPAPVTMKVDDSITESYNLERITEEPTFVKETGSSQSEESTTSGIEPQVIFKEAIPAQSEESTTTGSGSSIDSKESQATQQPIEPVTEEKFAAEVTTEAKIESIPEDQQTGTHQPESQHPEIQQTESQQPAVQHSEAPQPEVQQPGTQQPGSQQPETQKPEVQHPEVHQPEVQQLDQHTEAQQPGTPKPEVQHQETHQQPDQTPGAQQPEIQLPETQQPEVQKPEIHHPESQQPEAQRPDVKHPETQQPEVTTQVGADATENALGEESSESPAESSTPTRIANNQFEHITEVVPEVPAEEVTTSQPQQSEIVTEQRIAVQDSTTQAAIEDIAPTSSEPSVYKPSETTQTAEEIVVAQQDSTTQAAIEDIAPTSSDLSIHEPSETVTTQRAEENVVVENEPTTSQPIVDELTPATHVADVLVPVHKEASTEAQFEPAAVTTERINEDIQTEGQDITERLPITDNGFTEQQPIGSEASQHKDASEQTTLSTQTEKFAEDIATEAAIGLAEESTTLAAPVHESEHPTEANVAEEEIKEDEFIGSKVGPIITTQAPLTDEDEELQKTTIQPVIESADDKKPEEEIINESPIQTVLYATENLDEYGRVTTVASREPESDAGESTTLGAIAHNEIPQIETTQAPLEQPASTEAPREVAGEQEHHETTPVPALPVHEIATPEDSSTHLPEEDEVIPTTQHSEAGADELPPAQPTTESNKIFDLTTILSPQIVDEISLESTTAAKEQAESIPSRIGTEQPTQEPEVATESIEAPKAPSSDAVEPESIATSAPAIETTVAPIVEKQTELPIAHDESQTQGAGIVPSAGQDQEQQPTTQRPFSLDTTTIKSVAELLTTLQPIREIVTEGSPQPQSPTLAPEYHGHIPLIREPVPADDIIDTTTKLAENFDITTLPSILSSHTFEQVISDSITTVNNKQDEIRESETPEPLQPSSTSTSTPTTTTTTSTTTTTTTTTTEAPSTTIAPPPPQPPAIYHQDSETEYETHKPPSYGNVPPSPSSFESGYGNVPSQYPDDEYTDEEEPAVFGPGTCRYGGKLYVSAQQIPRDDPCDFCFCFRSDIICLQQSCPPPISGCHEEPIQGFCCPRYECPVSLGLVMNTTSTTTTTTTTLPPHFAHFARNNAKVSKRGCQIQGATYQIGERVSTASGPCIDCMCGGDGRMKCDPKACTPEPMLRQMIAVAASRR